MIVVLQVLNMLFSTLKISSVLVTIIINDHIMIIIIIMVIATTCYQYFCCYYCCSNYHYYYNHYHCYHFYRYHYYHDYTITIITIVLYLLYCISVGNIPIFWFNCHSLNWNKANLPFVATPLGPKHHSEVPSCGHYTLPKSPPKVSFTMKITRQNHH